MSPDTALMTLALHAAYVDGAQDEHERQHLRELAASLDTALPGLARLTQQLLRGQAPLAAAVAALPDLPARQLAYEMALGVCEADGQLRPAERDFLAGLKQQLGLGADPRCQAADTLGEALAEVAEHPEAGAAAAGPGPSAIARGPVAVPAPGAPTAPTAGAALPGDTAPARVPAPATADPAPPAVDGAALDRSILQHAILAGALELLPQSWATLAILPLQIKLVHGIGQAHGHALDSGHIKEFLATAGLGLGSQVLEQYGRKLLGGLFGQFGGKTGRKIGAAATGMAFSFASTYAIGQLARRHYGSGRRLDAAGLRQAFQQLLGPAQTLASQHLPAIRQQAAGLDAGQLMGLLKGGLRV